MGNYGLFSETLGSYWYLFLLPCAQVLIVILCLRYAYKKRKQNSTSSTRPSSSSSPNPIDRSTQVDQYGKRIDPLSFIWRDQFCEIIYRIEYLSHDILVHMMRRPSEAPVGDNVVIRIPHQTLTDFEVDEDSDVYGGVLLRFHTKYRVFVAPESTNGGLVKPKEETLPNNNFSIVVNNNAGETEKNFLARVNANAARIRRHIQTPQ